ncbi:Pleckstrin homology domain-containing protein [Roridomyces roridus]|uniref:Pleckstrin homology domain-containing protein n=1 Tax=Roridomyces roridus TaxID=1738132 RepID=A0AAD7CD34_9AGAR|nr:Pleckstrin homology domain-containing protein [Roridomyces roridus]
MAAHKRVFIGPLPDKLVDADIPSKADDNLAHLFKEHAFAFFINQGGHEEDWEESREQSVGEEMLRRWRETEWGIIRRRKQTKTKQLWIGSSFEVGNILGVNVLEESIHDRMSSRSAHSRSTRRPVSSTTNLHDEVTSFFAAEPGDSSLRPPLTIEDSWQKAQSDYSPRPTLQVATAPIRSDTHVPAIQRERAVHYAQLPTREDEIDSPAPPNQVLERTTSEIPETSAQAMLTNPVAPQSKLPPGTIYMRDRMLVRFGYTRDESLGPHFDDERSRKTRGIRYAEWAEFMVIWRDGFIQFYEQSNVPGTKWLTGSKYRLAFEVPIKNEGKTRLSLYSFVDLSFCLTCPPSSHSPAGSNKANAKERRHRRIFPHWTKEGTNIFICKLKSRSRAVDWLWELWLQLGGRIPPSLEVRNPSLGTRVSIDLSGDKGYAQMCTRENIIALCMRSLRRVKDWQELVEAQLAEGKKLELAWRMGGTQMDWVWLDEDVNGAARRAAVLGGIAMELSTGAPQLEVRLAHHSPQQLFLKNGVRLPEPPAIEGYLDRVRANTQGKQPVYIVTHDGNIFVLRPADANPPSPVGIGAGRSTEGLRREEVRRGAEQVVNAFGVTDLRSVVTVRRAFQVVAPMAHDERIGADDLNVEEFQRVEERCDSDGEDEGGEEALRAAKDKPYLRMKRSFELLLKNGSVVRFEAHSRKVALEWIDRLRQLVLYWRQKHHSDAAEEMDLAQAYAPRLTPRRHLRRNDSEIPPEGPVDIQAPLPALGSLYSWCVLEGCRPIVRGGRLYMRRGLSGEFKFVHLFLIPGHLVHFRIKPKSTLHTAVHKDINLTDAFVTSGYFAALTLPDGQYTATSLGTEEALPRRYEDGLETNDSDEDTLFMVCYHPHRSAVGVAVDWYGGTDSAEGSAKGKGKEKAQADVPRIPSLAAERKVAVFRCRNRLERDAWCWALNCEIEKLVRVQREREERVRGTGGDFKGAR